MRFIQITDLHIPPAGEKPYDIDIRGNFLKLLDKVKVHQPTFLVVSGDLCFRDGQDAIYEWIKTQLDETQIPYFSIPGNHDDPAMMARHFCSNGAFREGAIFFAESIPGCPPMLFLDTTPGFLSNPQLNWLAEQLATLKDQTLLLFIHHPVVEAGTPYMDINHSLKNKEAVIKLLTDYGQTTHVFSGHFHVDKTVVYQNIIQYITPSCFFQISQWNENFQVDHKRIGFREVNIEENKLLSTVVYIDR